MLTPQPINLATLGLSAVALTDNPRFPTYPGVPSKSDITAGLASAYAASALLGQSGAVALLIVLFMAVTSCASAELIAVASLLTFDVYKVYIKPTASPDSLITVSHICICIFGITMALFACIWNAIGIDLGWLFLVMGLLIGGAVFPAAFAITWAGQSRAGAIAGCISGLVAGLVAWLVTAYQYFGEVTVASTGEEYSTLAGNLAAIMTGLIVTVVVSLLKPQNFDWEITRAINAKPLEAVVADPSANLQEQEHSGKFGASVDAPATIDDEEKEKSEAGTDTPPNKDLPTVQDEEKEMQADAELEEHPAKLKRAFFIACLAAFLLTFTMDFLVSMKHAFPFLLSWSLIGYARYPSPCFSRTMSSARASSPPGWSYRSSGSSYPAVYQSYCRLWRPRASSRSLLGRSSVGRGRRGREVTQGTGRGQFFVGYTA